MSVVSLVIAVLALRWAQAAHALAEESTRRATAAEQRIKLDLGSGGPERPHVAAALGDADNLSDACHTVIRALDAGGEPPTSNDYSRVQRCSDRFTVSVGLMRASEDGDLTRELTDELVTLNHCVLTEVRQHQQARFPFVGARDTTVANQMLSRFDAELTRLRQYARTGSVPASSLPPVDFETVRFVPRTAPGQGAPPTGA